MQTLHEDPRRFRYFGDVGPSDGCGEIDRLVTAITSRDATQFRAEYVKAAEIALGPGALLNTSPMWFPNKLRDTFGKRIAEQVDVQSSLLSNGSAEILRHALRWSHKHGYNGRRLGYNKSGRSYWAFNPASTWFVCANPPADRDAVLGDWIDR